MKAKSLKKDISQVFNFPRLPGNDVCLPFHKKYNTQKDSQCPKNRHRMNIIWKYNYVSFVAGKEKFMNHIFRLLIYAQLTPLPARILDLSHDDKNYETS